MKIKALLLFAASFGVLVAIGQTAQQVLEQAIQYHDPNGEWPTLNAQFDFTETRPNGADRITFMILDNKSSYMKLNRNDEEAYQLMSDEAVTLIGDGDEARAIRMRNYYLYLWGLPMKLLDEGTQLDETVKEEPVGDVPCYVLTVYYEAETYYFHFDKESGRMMQYTFIKVGIEKGEVIKLRDEISFGTIKIPQKRSWYTIPENKFLGMDTLDKVTLRD